LLPPFTVRCANYLPAMPCWLRCWAPFLCSAFCVRLPAPHRRVAALLTRSMPTAPGTGARDGLQDARSVLRACLCLPATSFIPSCSGAGYYHICALLPVVCGTASCARCGRFDATCLSTFCGVLFSFLSIIRLHGLPVIVLAFLSFLLPTAYFWYRITTFHALPALPAVLGLR
jgi:hypothetical protein